MASEAVNILENVPNRQVSGVDTQGRRGSEPEHGINGPDEAIFTGFYKKIQQLSND